MPLRLDIRKLKASIWVASAGTFVFAGWTFYDIFTLKQQKHYEPRRRDFFVQQVLRANVRQGSEPRQTDFYKEEDYSATWSARIDGSVAQAAVDPALAGPPPEPAKPQLKPLDSVVKVDLILWAPQPELRFAAVGYTEGQGPAAPVGGAAATVAEGSKEILLHLSEGDPLKAPYDAPPYNGRIVRIDPQEVVIHWGDEDVILTPKLGADGAGQPNRIFSVPEVPDVVAGREAPAETEQVQPGHWILGTLDRERAGREPQKFLDEQLRLRTVTPAGGGRSALELTQDPEPGSLAAKFGAKKGDRLISVNGVPMSSISSAINWFKQNSGLPTYVVVYEPSGTGKQETITIHSK